MPARYRSRTKQYDAGRFTLNVTVEEDGSALVSVVYITPDGGIQTVCHLSGHPDAAPGESVLNVCDAYDSSNRLAITPGGGTPAPWRPPARPCDRCGKDLGKLPAGAPPRLNRCADCKAAA